MTTRREFLGAVAGALALGVFPQAAGVVPFKAYKRKKVYKSTAKTVAVTYAFVSESGDSDKPPFVCVFAANGRHGRVRIDAPEYRFFRERRYQDMPRRAGEFVGLRIRESSVNWREDC